MFMVSKHLMYFSKVFLIHYIYESVTPVDLNISLTTGRRQSNI